MGKKKAKKHEKPKAERKEKVISEGQFRHLLDVTSAYWDALLLWQRERKGEKPSMGIYLEILPNDAIRSKFKAAIKRLEKDPKLARYL